MDTLAVSFETNLSSSHCDETVAYCDVTVLPSMLEHCWLCLFATAWCFPHLQETTCYSRAVTYTSKVSVAFPGERPWLVERERLFVVVALGEGADAAH